MNSRILIAMMVGLSTFVACEEKDPEGINNLLNENGNSSSDWLIPKNEVRDGGPGKDGIPAISDPEFTDASSIDYLSGNDLVLGYVSGNTINAYPHPILDWHEIINDDVNGTKIAITYCPLTGTGIGWDRMVNGKETTFGVSGLLYNSNLIPYDRETNSNWSQMRLDCVNGEVIGTVAKTYQLVETTWDTWKEMYPNTRVISVNTGYSRSYGNYPYDDYKVADWLLFPVNNSDERLSRKERVHGVISDGKVRVYGFNNFVKDIQVVEDELNSTPIVVAGSKEKNFIVSFERTLNDTILSFEAVNNKLPSVLIDNEGTEWDIFGNAVCGPRLGQQLTPTTSFIGYWFAWAAFYPDLEIYEPSSTL